jgi:AcrR family transcriptional regulator
VTPLLIRSGAVRLTSDFSTSPDQRRKGRRQPQEKLEQIVRSATAVFAERGYHAATIHEICASAKVSVGSFYSHFDDKRELMIRVIEDLARSTIPPLGEWDFADVRQIAAHIERFFADRVASGVWRAWREAVLEDPTLRPVEDRLHHFAVEHYATAVTKTRLAKGVGASAALDPEVVAWVVLALVRDDVSNHDAAPPNGTIARVICDLALLVDSPSREAP